MCSDTCKIITTKKGTNLLVPCPEKEDQHILLITATGGFRGDWGKIEVINGEIISQRSSCMHCCPVAHIVAVVKDGGYVRTETGRRSSRGTTEVYSWSHGYMIMDTEEYNAAVETENLFSGEGDIEKAIATNRDEIKKWDESRKNKIDIIPKLKELQVRDAAAGRDLELEWTDDPLDFRFKCRRSEYIFDETSVKEVELLVEKDEGVYSQRITREEWISSFEAALREYPLLNEYYEKGKGIYVDLSYRSRVYMAVCKCCRRDGWTLWADERCEFSAEGLDKFKELLPRKASELNMHLLYMEEQRRIAAEAEAKARAEAEAKAKQKALEAEAREAGYPSDIRIWHRVGGATNLGEGWVIRPDGSCRDNDRDTIPRYKSDGDLIWEQILPGELVLAWRKAYTAAPHEFEVVYKPNTLTEAQLEKVAEIQADLSKEFKGLKGLASGKESPDVGDGWGLF